MMRAETSALMRLSLSLSTEAGARSCGYTASSVSGWAVIGMAPVGSPAAVPAAKGGKMASTSSPVSRVRRWVLSRGIHIPL